MSITNEYTWKLFTKIYNWGRRMHLKLLTYKNYYCISSVHCSFIAEDQPNCLTLNRFKLVFDLFITRRVFTYTLSSFIVSG